MNEPSAASEWQRFASVVWRGLAGVRASCATSSAVREYTRVVPVLAGQVREAASDVAQLTTRSRQVLLAWQDRCVANAKGSVEAATRLEDAIAALKIISLRADGGTPLAEGIRALITNVEESLTLTMADLRRRAETDAAMLDADTAAHADTVRQCQDRVDQRLRHVIETLSEMQDEFVDALERPDGRTGRTGRTESAALRLRQRYTAAEARR